MSAGTVIALDRTTPWRRLRHWIREFLGENDYARYLDDWRAQHDGIRSGGHRPLTAREFFDERLRIRYGGGIQRCC